MIPTRADITTLVLSLLGDTQVSGGTIYTSAFQAAHLNLAYGELFSKLNNLSAERVQRQGYYVLPAYTGYLLPSTASISNFGGPSEIRERGTVTKCAITAATPSTPTAGSLRLTLSTGIPASGATGDQAQVYAVGGISTDVNDNWTITVQSTTSIDLNGCAASGTFTSGGSLAYSTEQWSDPLDMWNTTDNFPTSPQSELGMLSWENGILRFPPCSAARELRFLYFLSGSLPVVASPVTTDSMGIDDSLWFLANRTAQYAGSSKGNPRAAECQKQADYFLNEIISRVIRDMQGSETVRPSQYRVRRSMGYLVA